MSCCPDCLKEYEKLGQNLRNTRTILAYSHGNRRALIQAVCESHQARPFARRAIQGKKRSIDNPVDIVKELQERAYKRILRHISLPEHIFGGVCGKSSLNNIEQHLGSEVLITLDIRSFFPSITPLHIFHVWRNLLGCSPSVARILTQLTTFERHLPQGASTSSTLSNLVLYVADEEIRNFCTREGIRYSNWIDDLAFSGADPRTVINVAVASLRSAGFAISHRKLKIMPAHRRQVLTGIVLNQTPGVLKVYRSSVRSGIHKLGTGCVPQNELGKYVTSLRGKIAYINRINPKQAAPPASALEVAMKRISNPAVH